MRNEINGNGYYRSIFKLLKRNYLRSTVTYASETRSSIKGDEKKRTYLWITGKSGNKYV